MKHNLFYPFLVGCCLMAIGASGKAMIDIAVLKKDNINKHELLMLLHSELKEMRSDIKELLKQ